MLTDRHYLLVTSYLCKQVVSSLASAKHHQMRNMLLQIHWCWTCHNLNIKTIQEWAIHVYSGTTIFSFSSELWIAIHVPNAILACNVLDLKWSHCQRSGFLINTVSNHEHYSKTIYTSQNALLKITILPLPESRIPRWLQAFRCVKDHYGAFPGTNIECEYKDMDAHQDEKKA